MCTKVLGHLHITDSYTKGKKKLHVNFLYNFVAQVQCKICDLMESVKLNLLDCYTVSLYQAYFP